MANMSATGAWTVHSSSVSIARPDGSGPRSNGCIMPRGSPRRLSHIPHRTSRVSRSPARRHSPSHASSHGGGNADRATHEVTKFRRLKSAKDRNDAVVTTDFMKAQRKGYQPEP